jgi:hypothetical protein
MANTQLFYDDVVNVVFDNYGKTHEVKEAKGNWKYINLYNSKLSVSKLPTKPLIRNMDDVHFRYIFCGWHQKYPCIAIDYLIYMKHLRKKITFKQYYATKS